MKIKTLLIPDILIHKSPLAVHRLPMRGFTARNTPCMGLVDRRPVVCRNLAMGFWVPLQEGEKERRRKKPNNNHKQGNRSPEGAEQAKSEPRTARGKVRRTRTRPGGRPARPGQAGHAHAHTRGTRAWRSPTQKGRCRRPHKTAPLHWPSPPSQDGWYGKPDASVTGSTHVKPPQRTQPKTEAGGTRQGQPHCGAPNGYDAERAQRPCLGRGQRQAQ